MENKAMATPEYILIIVIKVREEHKSCREETYLYCWQSLEQYQTMVVFK